MLWNGWAVGWVGMLADGIGPGVAMRVSLSYRSLGGAEERLLQQMRIGTAHVGQRVQMACVERYSTAR